MVHIVPSFSFSSSLFLDLTGREGHTCGSQSSGGRSARQYFGWLRYRTGNDYTTRIPEETLLVIFRHTLPPSWTARNATTLPPFPRTGWSADLTTKLSLISVCKTWHRVALQFLYESVTLHSIGQLPAFVRALEARAAIGVGSFVRRLEIAYWVPRGYHSLHNAELKTIFALCPRLTHFAYNPQVLPGEPLPAFPGPAHLAHAAIAHLEISDRVPYPAVLPALAHLAPTLSSLSILLPLANSYPASRPPLAFPHLSSLRLGLADTSALPGPGARWALPSLQHLLIRASGMHLSAAGYNALARALLDAYGGPVRVLTVLPVRGGYEVQDLLERCPALEHLCVSGTVAGIETAGLHHGTLRSLELLRDPASADADAEAQERDRLKGVFPALRACRYVDPCYELFPQLPPTPTPSTHADAAPPPSSCDLPASSWLAFMTSSAFSDESDADSDADADYVFDPAEDDGGSVLSSDSDSDSDSDAPEDDHDHDHDSDSEWAGEAVDVDRERALAIFRRTLMIGSES